MDEEPSREILVAQIEALQAVVRRQKHLIDAMRASHFWKLRDAFFAARRRFGNGIEPLPRITSGDLGFERAAFGDPYQLFRIREARSADERAWLRRLAQMLKLDISFTVLVDDRVADENALAATESSLRDQIYAHYRVRSHRTLGPLFVPADEDFVVVLEPGDVLEPDALLSLAVGFNDGADVVYGDEDRFDADGVPIEPRFKPDWSPETALTRNYVGAACAFRGSALRTAGGLEAGGGSSAVYDALLRVTDRATSVEHVPRVLLHRRSDAPRETIADTLSSVQRAIDRRNEPASAIQTPWGIDVRFAVPGGERVTIVVPTRDRADLIGRCLSSVFERTAYADFDVLVVDNGSREASTEAVFEEWRRREPSRFRVLRDDAPFNYSRLNNRAVTVADAPFVLLLNNDTEVIEREWLGAMLAQARRAAIGAVGALLLYEDGTVQHAGIVLGGVLELAGHAFRFDDPERDEPRLHLDTNYLAVTGACLLVSRAKYLEVGGLDEDLAVSYNDVDFCLKLRAAGYRNVLVPRARLFHYESKSRGRDDTKQKVAVARSEVQIVRERWPQWAQRDPYYNPNLTLEREDFTVRTW